MSEDEIHRQIAHAPEGDRTLEALIGLIEIAAEAETQAALASSPDAHQRAYDCGRAASLRDILSDIEAIRDAERLDN